MTSAGGSGRGGERGRLFGGGLLEEAEDTRAGVRPGADGVDFDFGLVVAEEFVEDTRLLFGGERDVGVCREQGAEGGGEGALVARVEGVGALREDEARGLLGASTEPRSAGRRRRWRCG